MHPIEKIEWRHADSLKGNDYNPNIVFNPELRLLEHSLLATGWIQPVLINGSDIIIDGFHRAQIALNSKSLHARDGGMVPCCVLPVSDAEARMMTIRINRAKGAHQAKLMSGIVQELIDDFGLTREEIKKGIGATTAELDLLYAGDVFIAKDIKNAKYSKAWIPVEAP
jgi:ParB-like chromosome segregation protein Spo0J